MNKTKIVAAYLPQYYATEDNNRFWGEGYTDWFAVKKAKPLYDGHAQPRVPLDENYYDLSKPDSIKWQADLAGRYGVDAFNIYHYWFRDGKQELEKPAEILLQRKDIDIEFFFSWDNSSWVRSWSNVTGGNSWAPAFDANSGKEILLEMDYGDETQWTAHFYYLLPFFRDSRYLKVDGKPVFGFMRSGDVPQLKRIRDHWQALAKKEGFPGLYLISSRRTFFDPSIFDNTFLYEPVASGFGKRNAIDIRVKKYTGIDVGRKGPCRYLLDYEKYWRSVIRNARSNRHNEIIPGGLVGFDDTPRRGKDARIIKGGTPQLFGSYFEQLYGICCENDKKMVILTAWNEWGEGAYLEPDEKNGFQYLEALLRAKNNVIKGF